MGHNSHRARPINTMKALLVCSVLAAVSADPQVILGGLGYPYAYGSALTYTPHVVKPVVKEIEVPVKTITYGIKETGCKNSFGFPVPCLAEGEARRKREAEEEKAAAAPAITVAEPKVTEVEVPQYVYKAVEEKIDLAPLCHNGFGFPVPCA